MTLLTAINALAALLILTSISVVSTSSVRSAAIRYAIQSVVLVIAFVVLGFAHEARELFIWAGTATLTKVIGVPALLLFMLKKVGQAEAEGTGKGIKMGSLSLPGNIPVGGLVAISACEVALCLVVVNGVELPVAQGVKPALALSLAHFFIGVTCIVSQNNILKQILGFCLMENGSHLTLALLAPGAPEMVEIGVTTDAIFAMVIMALLAYRIYKTQHTLDARDLTELKG